MFTDLITPPTELYHGTLASVGFKVMREGMYDRTPATEDLDYAKEYGRTKPPKTDLDDAWYAVIVLDVVKAGMKRAVTGYYESDGPVLPEGILRVEFYRQEA